MANIEDEMTNFQVIMCTLKNALDSGKIERKEFDAFFSKTDPKIAEVEKLIEQFRDMVGAYYKIHINLKVPEDSDEFPFSSLVTKIKKLLGADMSGIYRSGFYVENDRVLYHMSLDNATLAFIKDVKFKHASVGYLGLVIGC